MPPPLATAPKLQIFQTTAEKRFAYLDDMFSDSTV